MGIDNFSGVAPSVDRGKYNVENLKVSRDHHKNQKTRPKGKYIFYLHSVSEHKKRYIKTILKFWKI